jgi:hypothetical protein
MAKSDATRAGVQQHLEGQKREANRAQGRAEAEGAVIVAKGVEDTAIKRVARRILGLLPASGAAMTRGELRGKLAGRDRAHFDAAIERLIEAGQVHVDAVEYQGQTGAKYRRAEPST